MGNGEWGRQNEECRMKNAEGGISVEVTDASHSSFCTHNSAFFILHSSTSRREDRDDEGRSLSQRQLIQVVALAESSRLSIRVLVEVDDRPQVMPRSRQLVVSPRVADTHTLLRRQ